MKEMHQRPCERRNSLLVVLDHQTEANYSSLIELINDAMCSSDVDSIDILNESPSTLTEDQIFSLVCLCNVKLGQVTFEDLPFRKHFLRDLFQSGLACRALKLSSPSLQKLDMVGKFMRLQKLNLDYCSSLNKLQKDCFSQMPNLIQLSICGSRLTDLWTTTSALSKLPSLVELRFQNCSCCEDTTACPAYCRDSENTVKNTVSVCVDHLQRLSLLDFNSKKYISHHPSPICFEKHYRDFMISSLPRLKVLDNIPIGKMDRKLAKEIYSKYFESFPYERHPESVVQILHNREIASKSKSKRSSLHSFSRSLCASKLGASPWPLMHTVSNFESLRPRQFEYHPSDSSQMAVGTLDGEVVVVNHENGKMVSYMPPSGSRNSILGLCWLKKYPSKVLAGSDNGLLRLFDISKVADSCSGSEFVIFEKFDQLTSVHINSRDEQFLVSGYTGNVALYDMGTGKRQHLFSNLHKEPINVAKFAHHSPFLFATSSFDRDVKMWDTREGAVRPCYSATSSRGNVMVCFSSDDHYLLISAVDNEVKQLLAVDGRLHTDFGITSSGSSHNYTRSYYMNGSDYIITGSSDEHLVRVCCANTGRRLRDIYFEGRGSEKAVFVQSLRSDPFRPFNMSILASYAQSNSKCEIIKVNMLAQAEDATEDYSSERFRSSFSLGG